MRQRVVLFAAGVSIVLVCGRPSTMIAQRGGGGGQQRPPENLKVMPADTPRPVVVARMREFAMALGTRCEHCHAGPVEDLNYASDEKPEKETARAMMRLVASVNESGLAKLPKHSEPAVKVDCVTCHRGLVVPTTLQAMLIATVEKSGAPAAMAQYKELRAKEAYTGRYDFSGQTLAEAGRALAAKGNVDAAIGLLELNAEVNPSFAGTDVPLAQLYIKKGDKDKAIASLQNALQKNPNDRNARRLLDELQKK